MSFLSTATQNTTATVLTQCCINKGMLHMLQDHLILGNLYHLPLLPDHPAQVHSLTGSWRGLSFPELKPDLKTPVYTGQ